MEAEEHIENTFQNGESLKDVEKRISNFIDEINRNEGSRKWNDSGYDSKKCF